MKKRINYTNEPMKFKEMKDFIPSLEHLAFKEKNVKVTITLSQNSVDYFKKFAKKTRSHYQTMIRKIIDYYVMHHAA
jgi:predicted DNA binding CopG/RHH family protein